MEIKKKWVAWEEIEAILGGATFTPSTDVDLGSIGGLNPGAIPFGDADGFLTEDYANLFWDAAEKNLGIGTDTFGADMIGGVQVALGTVPTADVADTFAFYAADFAAGNACPYFRTENGTVIGLNQSLLTTDNLVFAGVTLGNEGLHILDTNDSHDLIMKAGSDLTADRILSFVTGDVARTITFSGNPTLGDWFDQAVKQASTPTLDDLTITTPVNIYALSHNSFADYAVGQHRIWEDSIVQDIHNNNISEGSVTQHVEAIDHDALLNTHANPYKLDDLAAPDDNTDLDFSTAIHGLVPKGTDVGAYLKDDGTWAVPAGGGDVTAGANITDHAIVRGDGGAKGVQSGSPTICDAGWINCTAALGIKFSPTSTIFNLIRSYSAQYEAGLHYGTRYPLIYSTASTGAHEFINHAGTPLFAIKGNGEVWCSSSLTVAGVSSLGGHLSNTGGCKLEVQNAVDGGNTKGIFMWSSADPNWGIYMGQSGAGKSLAAGAAVASISGGTSHHIRFRVHAADPSGFIWENSSESCLMSLKGDAGHLYLKGRLHVAGDFTPYIHQSAANTIGAYNCSYWEVKPSSDSYGIIFRDAGSTEYGNIKNVNGVTYIGDGTGTNSNMIAINGTGVTFPGNIALSSATSTITGGTKLNIEAGATGICSYTIYLDTTVLSENMYIHSTPYGIRRVSSASKYKDKIKDLELDSSLIYNLRPVSFNSKCKGDDKKRRFIGLIADEIEPICPDIISYNENNEAEGYDNRMLMTLMLAETQRHEKRIAELEARLNI